MAHCASGRVPKNVSVVRPLVLLTIPLSQSIVVSMLLGCRVLSVVCRVGISLLVAERILRLVFGS